MRYTPGQYPNVGEFLTLDPEFILDTENQQIPIGTDVTVAMRYISNQFDKLYVYVNGQPLKALGSQRYEVLTTTVQGVPNLVLHGTTAHDTTLPTGLASLTVRYAVNTKTPYVHWLAGTYAGSLLGLAEIPRKPLPMRSTLLKSLVSETDVEFLAGQITASSQIPEAIRDYVPLIKDPLEKAIFVSTVCAIYLV